MKETTLLKIALICSFIGLIVLYFTSLKIEPAEYSPKLNKNLGDEVKLSGIVAKVNEHDNVVFVELDQQSQLTLVVFAKNLSIKRGDLIEVIGNVQEYNGKEEIIAQKIRVINPS